MNSIDPPDKLPEALVDRYPLGGFGSRRLRDKEFSLTGPKKDTMRKEVEKVIKRMRKKTVFKALA